MNPLTALVLNGILETLYMTIVSTVFGYVLGLPLGMILAATAPDGITPAPTFNKVLGFIVNVVRSVPFIILLVAILPFTRAVVGTTLGSTATIVPLTLCCAPYIARVVESSIKEVDQGVVEAALSMGATPLQVMLKVQLPEAKPSLLVGAAITVTAVLGYSTMAGFVGGGGLGAIAINYGYYRYDTTMMLITVCLLVVIVQLLQEFGMRVAIRTDKRQNNLLFRRIQK